LRAFLEKVPEAKGKITFSDDFPVYHCVLDKEAHFTGKMLTQRVESLNANIRHHLARFRRKTRCTTKSKRMAYLSVLLFAEHHNEKLVS